MADVRAIMAVSQAVVSLLEGSYSPALFNTELEFQTFATSDFEDRSIQSGISLFLYRVFVNGAHRTPTGRLDALGRRQQTRLPLELHFFLTVWAGNAALQHAITGWMMRTIEDAPILPASLLNSVAAGSFRNDEFVGLNAGDLSNEDLLRIWDTLGAYQLSVPYVARVVHVESTELDRSNEGEPVIERHQDMGVVERVLALNE